MGYSVLKGSLISLRVNVDMSKLQKVIGKLSFNHSQADQSDLFMREANRAALSRG